MKQDMRNGFMVTWKEDGRVLIQIPDGNLLKDIITIEDEESLNRVLGKLRYLIKFKREIEEMGSLNLEIPDSPAINVPETKGMGSPKKKQEKKKKKK